MKKLVLIFTLLCSTVFAGEKIEKNGLTYYRVMDANYNSSRVSLLICGDYRDAYADSALEEMSTLVQDAFKTNTVLFCQVSALRGDVSAYPTSIGYVVNGTNYNVNYDEYTMVEGDPGMMREDANLTFLVAFPDAARGQPFTLHWGSDNVEVVLPE